MANLNTRARRKNGYDAIVFEEICFCSARHLAKTNK